MKYRPFKNNEVKTVFDGYPKVTRENLLSIRELIFETANAYDEIGEIEETLKWEVPGYLTHSPKSGTTIRLSIPKGSSDEYALSVHCQSNLISEFRAIYPKLNYSGNRSLIFNSKRKVQANIIKHFIYAALSYHYRNKHGIGI